jgi:SAM-dependent methyltransferase
MKTGHNLLYGRLAWVFPLFSPLKTYRKETAMFSRLIRKHALRPVKMLLHLGCGAGHNDYFFKRPFSVTGVDLSRTMLRQARKLNPEAEYRVGDFRTVRLGRTFDAVVCVDSLDYMTTEKGLAAVFWTAYHHLEPGGVFFFLLETTRESYRPNRVFSWTFQGPGVAGAFAEAAFAASRSGTTYEKAMVFLIRKAGKIKVHSDIHRFGLFRKDQVLRLLRESGFRPHCILYKPPAEAIELGGTDAQARYPMFFAVKPLS